MSASSDQAISGSPAAAAGERGAARRLDPRGLLVRGLHLSALSALAIAQPILDLVSRYPEFFAARGSTTGEIVLFALALTLLPPLPLILLEALAGLASRRLAWGLHLVFVALLAALLALQVVNRVDLSPSGLAIAAAVAVGALAALAYARVAALRSFVTVLAPAPLVFVVLFLFFSPVSKLTFEAQAAAGPRVSSTAPVVMVVFDALPAELLMDERMRIDRRRYPNLAALADDAIWFPNTTTVYDSTVKAVPAILSGRLPRKGTAPILADHPDNLFTLLAGRYDIEVAEQATDLCPSALCTEIGQDGSGERIGVLASDAAVVYGHLVAPDGMRDGLPPLTDTWQDFAGFDRPGGHERKRGPRARNVLRALAGGGRPQQFRESVRAIGPERQPTLNWMHVFLPHEPLQYLPSGKAYQAGADPDPALDGPPSFDNEWLSQQSQQRHLLQTGFTDRLFGTLLARLRRTGLYDRALVVVVADHGVSFRKKATPAPPFSVGQLGFRREVSRANYPDIANVPLLVKLPRQRHGRVDERYARTIDVLPTIADALDVRLPFEVDGRSLLERRPPRVTTLETFSAGGGSVELDVASFEAKRRRSLERMRSSFGAGRDSLYRIGPAPQLLGRRVADLPQGRSRLEADIDERQRFARVDLRAPLIPAHVTGRVSGGSAEGRALAVALGGRIVATAVGFEDIGARELDLSIVLPERAFRAGRNRFELFDVPDPSAATPTLLRIAG